MRQRHGTTVSQCSAGILRIHHTKKKKLRKISSNENDDDKKALSISYVKIYSFSLSSFSLDLSYRPRPWLPIMRIADQQSHRLAKRFTAHYPSG